MNWTTEQIYNLCDDEYDLDSSLMGNCDYDTIQHRLQDMRDTEDSNIAHWTEMIAQYPTVEFYQQEKVLAQARKENIPRIGYEYINYRNQYPLLYSLREELADRFHLKYGRCAIVYASWEEWQNQLQTIFDDHAQETENELMAIVRYKEILGTAPLKNMSKHTSTSRVIEQPEYENNDFVRDKTINESTDTIDNLATQISNISAMYQLNINPLRKYINLFWPLFESVEWGKLQ